MSYSYWNIRFDSDYSLEVETGKVIDFIQTFPELKQTDKLEFKSQDNYPWGILSLIKCDNRGCFGFGEGHYFDKINLIQIIFADEIDSFDYYYALGLKITEEMNWEMIDDEIDELLIRRG